ncbi:MAG: hypothetical protein H7308_05745 [Chthonomonadaceae bacterium]|nr:hypothetical protein [Chthonomonadaceae bacterium]
MVLTRNTITCCRSTSLCTPLPCSSASEPPNLRPRSQNYTAAVIAGPGATYALVKSAPIVSAKAEPRRFA